MTYYNPSQMYAQMNSAEENKPEIKKSNNGQRLITLREAGEAYSHPDRVRCVISCCNTKKTADEVKSSTTRRIDYIIQTLRNNGVKESQYDVHKLISLSEDGQYNMVAELCVTFKDASTYEKTVNFLVEKLESSIHVSDAVFFVTPEKISDLRRQACLNAVRNCRTKALSVAQYLNQSLGSVLLVREEKTTEYVGSLPQQDSNNSAHVPDGKFIRPSIQQRIFDSTVTVHVKIYTEFECKERTKKANAK